MPPIPPQSRLNAALILWAPLILLALFVIGHVIRWGGVVPQAPLYNQGQFLFDYRDWGFVKRGLIASLFPQTPESVAGFTAWFSAAFCAVILALSALLLRLSRQPEAMLAVMASPFFLYTYGYDLGKLDVVAVAWFLGWLCLRAVEAQRTAWIAYSLSPLLLFVHEGFLFMVLPFFALVENARDFAWRRNLPFLALAAGCFAGIWLFGHAEERAAELHGFFESHFGADYLAHLVLTLGFTENLGLAWDKHLNPPNGHSALTVAVFLGLALLYPVLFRIEQFWIYGLAVLAIGAMFVLGSDWARWTALFASLGGIGLAAAAPLRPLAARSIGFLLLPLMLASLAAMPAGMVFIFQELESLLRNGHLTQW